MIKKPIQGFWGLVKSMMKLEGALNKVYDSNLDGVIDNSDKVDGYDAGTGANNVLVLDSNALVPLANIPVLDYSKLQFPGVRQSILAKFTNPKILIATSSALLLLNSVDKVEAASGNITATSQELTIVGGTATASGKSWIYWNLPQGATKLYLNTNLNVVNADGMAITLCNGDGSTWVNPPDFFGIYITPPNSAADFQLGKNVSGTFTLIAQENVDLSYDTYYNVEAYFEGDGSGNWNINVWRDDVLKFNATQSVASIANIQAVRICTVDSSTTAAQSGKVKGMVVIIYE